MTVKSPFRTKALPLQSVSNNTKSLVLQGKDLELVWRQRFIVPPEAWIEGQSVEGSIAEGKR